MRRNLNNTVVAAAGGCRGSGRTTAEQLIDTGAEVAIAAPDYDVALMVGAEISTHAHPLDVTDPAGKSCSPTTDQLLHTTGFRARTGYETLVKVPAAVGASA
ncbi:hypothetical protein [Streptomyces coffeae]|uniref:SDR family NAD(P)-dependent oxidoreductase n=1 Tax=Streptomyces coffeae TaxID=621382 RepID=A0ABS1NQ03_9ACTN|nr:hypothetical protein [Streptomyces coffeae]MBL1102099.1 hypothetical protein [Streptomyces coffeae]